MARSEQYLRGAAGSTGPVSLHLAPVAPEVKPQEVDSSYKVRSRAPERRARGSNSFRGLGSVGSVEGWKIPNGPGRCFSSSRPAAVRLSPRVQQGALLWNRTRTELQRHRTSVTPLSSQTVGRSWSSDPQDLQRLLHPDRHVAGTEETEGPERSVARPERRSRDRISSSWRS